MSNEGMRLAVATPRLDRGLTAVLRIGVALLWIQNAAWKAPPDFATLRSFTMDAVDHPVLAPYAWLVEHVILPNFTFFGWLTLLVEASLGGFLLVGLATRFWALVGVAQTTAITLSVLNTPNEWHWSYFLMLLAHLAIFGTAAAGAYSVDGLRRNPGRARLSRATVALGLAALASLLFIPLHGIFEFVEMREGSIPVTAVLGALAVVAGLLRQRLLTAIAGGAFLLTALVQLILLGHDNPLGGNGSTISLWLGLGAGLLAIGLTTPTRD
jgi:thiosulfate dehydrogenase [quinone] large subunit